MNGIPILHSGSEFRSGTLVEVKIHEASEDVTGEDIGEGPEWDLRGRRVSVALKQHMVTSTFLSPRHDNGSQISDFQYHRGSRS